MDTLFWLMPYLLVLALLSSLAAVFVLNVIAQRRSRDD
jgi:hypothetical protein